MPSPKISSAILLAAGMGTRMKSSIDYPKSMIMIGGKTLIERILENLYEDGVNNFVVNTHYRADLLEHHIKNLPISKKVKVCFSRESDLLETAGGVKNALHLIEEDQFFVANTDVFWMTLKNSAASILKNAWHQDMAELLLLIEKEKAEGYRGEGDFDLQEDSNIIFRKQGPHQYVYIGLQIIKKSFFENISPGKISFLDIWKQRTPENSYIMQDTYGVLFDGDWLHIGDPLGKEHAEKYFKDNN